MKKFVLLPWLGIALLNPLSAHANQSEQRWFEIEMVIFSQTPSQPVLEQFDTVVRPIKPGRSIDLLTELFQPDISKLLNELPLCQTDASVPMFVPPQTLLPADLCIFEQQPQPWEQISLFPQRFYISTVPYPEAIPNVVTGSGEHRSTPYLADKGSLQLNDLVKNIRRKADMQLLLHTAWRQAPVTERLAIASRWYAGRNFSEQFDYWGAAKTQDSTLPSEVDISGYSDGINLNLTPSNETHSDVIEGVAQLLQQLSANPQLPADTTDATAVTVAENQANELSLPNLPGQVWQLDGLFKLHLDHYLFVNTQFNLRQLNDGQLKSVYTQHSRRVISGEIHYLDHPYLGVILQIRRVEPEQISQPDEEAELPLAVQ